MKLAAASHAHLEDFLREHLREADLRLPRLRIYAGPVARLVTKVSRVGAITFGRHILVAPHFIRRDGPGRISIPGWLMAHEAMHVVQYARTGVLSFLCGYVRGYWRELNDRRRWDSAGRHAAYLSISEEVGARAAETAYPVWCAKRQN